MATILVILATVSQAATIANGGFESPNALTSPILETKSFANTKALTGWTVIGNVDLIGTHWRSSEGSYSLDLNGKKPAAISQLVTGLVSGRTYTILFDMSGNPSGDPDRRVTSKVVELSVNEGASVFTYNVETEDNRRKDMKWKEMAFSFTALDTATLLTFTSKPERDSPHGPALDNIRILSAPDDPDNGTPSPVPLPAGLLLLLSGLGVLALRRRT